VTNNSVLQLVLQGNGEQLRPTDSSRSDQLDVCQPSNGHTYTRAAEPQHLHAMAIVPECSSAQSARTEKSLSPDQSSSATTGTTSTPTSCDNVAALDNAHNNRGRQVFPYTNQQPGGIPWSDAQQYDPSRTSASMQHGSEDRSPIEANASPPQYNPANYAAAIKLLVSNNIAASIIGRAGKTISELQVQSRTRIKLSQSGDYFPGTQDRVCLVQGETECVKVASRMILERLYALQAHQHSRQVEYQLQKQQGDTPPSFDFVARLLVPSTCCGMIIGKSGSNIKLMEESTGVTSVRLSPKDAGYATSVAAATSERVLVIVSPHLERCTQCLFLVIDSMAAHSDISRYSNMTTSYSRIMTDPFVAGAGQSGPVPLLQPNHPSSGIWGQGLAPYGRPVVGVQRRILSAPDLADMMQSNRHQQSQQYHGLPSDPSRPVSLGSFYQEVQGSSFDSVGSSSTLPVYMLPAQLTSSPSLHPKPVREMTLAADVVAHVPHSHSTPNLLALQLEQSMHLSDHSITPPPRPTGSLHQGLPASFASAEGFVSQPPIMTAPGCFLAQALIPEQMVGSILGRGGSTLNDLQMRSGTRIRVSQRGEYMPGTRSRIVTVRGPTAQSVWQAQFLMSQRVVLPTTAAAAQANYHSSLPNDSATAVAITPPRGFIAEAPLASQPSTPTDQDDFVDDTLQHG
jgi:hypothetical protein